MELYPSVQKDLRTEVEAAFSQSKTPSLDQILDTNIPYLDAVCEESLRLAGTSKGNLRQAVIDTEILGCRIPKGAEVLLNLHINHPLLPVDDLKRSPSSKAAIDKHGYRLSDTITSSLSLFDPTRWLTRDQSTDSDVFNPYAVPSLAFGGGIRGCFGKTQYFHQSIHLFFSFL
jgi:cytochrome P450